jgi:hypothetical protein
MRLTPDALISAQARSGRLFCALVLSLGSLILAQFAFAGDQRIEFDIPAAPLDQALDAFGAASGFQIFYESALTASRRSTTLKGTFDRETALKILLNGSNLTARTIADGTITIAQPEDMNAMLIQAKRASIAYYGSMQTAIMKALCRTAETRPGAYRAAMQYWVDAAGRIAQFRLIGSSGNKDRDEAIGRALRTVVFQSPFGSIPQPVTLTIEPSASEELSACTPDRARAGGTH